MATPVDPGHDPTVVLGTAPGGEAATRVQPPVPLPGGNGADGPPPPPGLGGGGSGEGRDPRQNALLIAAGAVLAAIAVVAVLLATHSSGGSKLTSATSSPATTAPITTVAPTTSSSAAPTTTTSSTVPATTTAAPAPTTTVPSPQQSLNAIVSKLGPVYAVSPASGQDKSMFVAVDHVAAQPGGGSVVVVDVYLYLNNAWQPQATVPLGADGSTGLLLPASQNATPITVSSVTGSAAPDFVVTTAAASSIITTIVSDQTGTWRAVPFHTPTGTAIGVPDATVHPTTITAVFNSCSPTCAQGAMQQVTFGYQGGTFVPLAG